MDQENLLRDVFEKLAYVSLDFHDELRVARYSPSGRRPYDRDYVLPDYQISQKGKVRIPFALQKLLEKEEKDDGDAEDDEDEDDDDFEDEDAKSDSGDDSDDDGAGDGNKQGGDEEDEEDEEETDEQKRKRLMQQRAEEERRKRGQEEEEQILRVSVERFTVPEVIFRPLDAGLPADLVGLAETIVQSINACPKPYHPALYQSIRITGGLSQLQNLQIRLEQELRTLVPSEYKLSAIELAESPIDQAWLGAKKWVQQTPYTKWSVSKDEWEGAGKRKAYTRLLLSNGGVYA
jgi:actin-related protein